MISLNQSCLDGSSLLFLFCLMFWFCHIIQWIYIRTVGFHSKVQMRSRGITCGAHITNQLPFAHPISHFQPRSKLALMHVLGFQRFPIECSVGNLNIVACRRTVLTDNNSPGSRRIDRSSTVRCNINAHVIGGANSPR